MEKLEQSLDALDLDADMNTVIARGQSSRGGVHMKEQVRPFETQFECN